MEKKLTQQQKIFLESKLHTDLDIVAQHFVAELDGQDGVKNNGYIKNISYLAETLKKMRKYSPLMSETLNKENYISVVNATKSDLLQWLKAPQTHQKQLEGLSQYLSFVVGQYNTLINTANAGKAFNYVLLPPSIQSEKEISTTVFQNDYQKAKLFLQKINLKNQLAKIDLGVLYNGMEFIYIKKLKNTTTLYKLPTQYCQITAPFSYGWRFSLDLTYFDTIADFGKDVLPELTAAYNVFVEKRKQKARDLGLYQYYPISPSSGWVFTSNLYFPLGVPTYTSSMANALDTLSYNELITSKLTYDLYKIMSFKIPTNPSTQKPSMDDSIVEAYLAEVDNLLPSNVIGITTPFDMSAVNISQTDDIEEVSNMAQQTISNSSGTPQQLLGSGDLKNGNSLKLASKIDIDRSNRNMYIQYENFINYQLLNLSEKYPFKISLFGNTFNMNEELNTYIGLYNKTHIGTDYLLATLGVEPFQMQSHAALLRTMNLTEQKGDLNNSINTTSQNNGKQAVIGGEETDGGANHDEYDDDA